jgi:hypothetical protein
MLARAAVPKAAKHQHKPADEPAAGLTGHVHVYWHTALFVSPLRLQLIGVLKVALGHRKAGQPNRK